MSRSLRSGSRLSVAEPPNVPNVETEPRATAGGVGGTAQLDTVNVHVESATIVFAGTAMSATPVAVPFTRAV